MTDTLDLHKAVEAARYVLDNEGRNMALVITPGGIADICRALLSLTARDVIEECAKVDGDLDSKARVAEELRQHLKLRYAADCKCGQCQVLPLTLIARAIRLLKSNK